jgi:molybdopterin molybdotransferase
MNDNQTNYTQHYMIDFEDAFKLIEDNACKLDNEVIPTKQSKGRILATDIYSPVDIPPFNNSAMDGYAVNYSDLNNASQDSPIKLVMQGLTAAGDGAAEVADSKGTAWKIMTGAPVPDGYDSIIPVENTQLVPLDSDSATESKQSTEYINCFSQPMKNAHIRTSGEDFEKGDLVLNKFKPINANRIMALTSLGIANVTVKQQPKIAVFSTGKELVDDLTQSLQSGQIYNSNMPFILEYLADLPVRAYNAGTNYDDVEAYQEALKQQLDSGANIIISTGAVSMGDFDFIPQTILKMGGEIIFHKIKIRPGKPVLFAKFPNGCFYFGLPGNPISATIGLRFFVTHLLRLLLQTDIETPTRSRLTEARIKKKGFTNILKANGAINDNAQFEAMVLTGQESFKIHPMIDANGWIVLDAELNKISQTSLVDFYPSNPTFE